ncbi:Nuclear polyadenylated RNA-binding protein NAB2 [Lachnellula suecica]|uniref:Nuclear polyadenylated RNA-binding protein NAB2 n=1 Tax=Lachnellula suecica TaxID=602035 RepID=A0A8T9CHZ4_9HELO|nr:Nuclear polyadenylated RNA-binding protein NAB2 [Lachnellula suecica]
MSVEVVLDTPLAQELSNRIQPKLVEVGWSTGGTETDLAEYIILMLVNGKTQDQIAVELSGDLLNLEADNPEGKHFSQWLFDQVETLNAELNGGNVPPSGTDMAQAQTADEGQDADMGDTSDVGQSNVYAISPVDLSPDLSLPLKPHTLTYRRPTGPKSMRDGVSRPRDRRMLGHLAKAMDRTNDSVLHKVRSHNGTERINSHPRPPPTGPRQQTQTRGGPRNMNGGRNGSMAGSGAMQNQSMNFNSMSPSAQMEMLAKLEQQMHGMAQMMQMNNGMLGNGYGQPQTRRSLADRVQPNPHTQQNGFRRGGKFGDHQSQPQYQAPGETPTSSMDVEMSQEKREPASPDNTCKYNLSCTNKDCKFAHQSPAAPPGAAIDVNDVCTFGAACKNRKCTGRHPSPAQKIAHQTEMDCKYFPNCTNARCPFRHPTMPLCRNGADCTTPDCKFTHSKVMCKFNPCLNAACVYKHEDGQKRGKFEDKVWVANGAKEHVSERKFVDENGEEELIRPGEEGQSQESVATEVIT